MLANDQLSTAIELIACFTYHASAQAGVAQLVEQRIRNAKVGGSTPLSGTTITLNSQIYQLRMGIFHLPLPNSLPKSAVKDPHCIAVLS